MPLEIPAFSTADLGSRPTAMAAKSKRKDGLDVESATKLLEEHWQTVTTEAAAKPDREDIPDDDRPFRGALPHPLRSDCADSGGAFHQFSFF
jgi:hypothetical protein